MNSGLRSVVNCPGHYSLQIAEFSGRSAFQWNPAQQPLGMLADLKESPLRTAHDDAERLAEKLAKDRRIYPFGSADLYPPRPDVQPRFRRFLRRRARSPGRRASREAFADGRAAR